MKTVLALDDLLARAVAGRVPGDVVQVGRYRMRDEGDDAVLRAIEKIDARVLVIGGARWNPSALLRRWKLPKSVRVVAVAPSYGAASVAIDSGATLAVLVGPAFTHSATRVAAACELALRALDISPVVVAAHRRVRSIGRRK